MGSEAQCVNVSVRLMELIGRLTLLGSIDSLI